MGAFVSEWLQKQWYQLGFWHLFLIPLSWIFWALSTLRRLSYKTGVLKSYKLPVSVLVVGNISVGGTGKTPLVIWLADRLKREGYRPAIISRGYGGSTGALAPVFFSSNPKVVGDEPVLLARRTQCPVWVGRDRVAVGRALLNAHPECNVIISDDGLQHYRLQRDVEIVVLDGARGLGNGYLLPAGPLRETGEKLKLVDALVSNGEWQHGCGLMPAHMRLEAKEFHNLTNPELTCSAIAFEGKEIHAIAGIGNPQRFFQQLKLMGLQFESHEFPDHHDFQPSDLQSMRAKTILMTEKDAVKCAAFAQQGWWFLPVNAVVDDTLMATVINKMSF